MLHPIKSVLSRTVHVKMVHTVSVWALAVQVSDFNSSKVSSLQLIGNFFENYEYLL